MTLKASLSYVYTHARSSRRDETPTLPLAMCNKAITIAQTHTQGREREEEEENKRQVARARRRYANAKQQTHKMLPARLPPVSATFVRVGKKRQYDEEGWGKTKNYLNLN